MSEENKPADVPETPAETPVEAPAPEAAAAPAQEASAPSSNASNKVLVGILAILVGSLGVHKFILGYKKEGFILLGVTIIGYVFACGGIGIPVVMATGVVGLIEGIMYLTKSDEEYVATYVTGQKAWF